MDKCWFVLRQHHYPPPREPSNPNEHYVGPICLGHIIPSLKGLDDVLNTSGPERFPNNMPVWPSTQWVFKWDSSHDRDIDVSANVEVPTTVAPIDVKADAGVLFKRSVKNHWEFDKLDTQIIQPTRAYIDDSLEDSLVHDYIVKKKKLGVSAWSLYMISGLMIARGAKKESSVNKETGVRAGGGVVVPSLADDGAHLDVNWKQGSGMSFEKSTDFVWAVRLMKISKSAFGSGWEKETVVKGATFSLRDGTDESRQVMLNDVLQQEGLGEAELFHSEGEDAFVLLGEHGSDA